jgi:hypothetical protein
MDVLVAVVVFGFLAFIWVFKLEMKKLCGHIAKASESIDSLSRPHNSTREIVMALAELETWLCGDKELRSRTLEALQARKLDEGEEISLSPLLPQIVARLDDIRRAVENTNGAPLPLGVATRDDLEQAADAAILAVGSSTVSHLSLLTRSARNNLRGKLFDDIDLNTAILTQMGRSKGTA